MAKDEVEVNVIANPEDLPPSLRASGDVPPSMRTPDQMPPSMRDPETLGGAAKGALSDIANPKKIWQAANTPLPPIESFRKGVDKALTSFADKLAPSEEDIVGKAQETGKIPYGKIIEKTMADTGAHFLSGMIPASPVDFAMMYGMGKAAGGSRAEIPEEGIPKPPESPSTGISTDVKKPDLLSVKKNPYSLTDPRLDFVVNGKVPIDQFKDFLKTAFPDKKFSVEKPSGAWDVDTYKVRFYGPEGQVEQVPEDWEKIFGKTQATPVDPREVISQTAQNAIEKVLPASSRSAEHLAIDADTRGSQTPRTLGIPPELVDSSEKLRGTDIAPALKPEVIPGTRAFSQKIWDRLIIPAAQAVAKQGPSGESLAADMIKVRDVPGVRYGMEFGAPFEKLYNQIPKVFTEELGKDIGVYEAPTQERIGQVTEQMGHEIQMILEGKSFESDLPQGLRVLRSQMAEEAKAGLRRVSDWAQVANDGEPIKIHRADGNVVDWAPRENYFPRLVKTEILESLVKGDAVKQRELAQYLLKSRQAPNSQVAVEQVRLFRKNLLDKKFGNIERSREMDLPPAFYENNAFKVIPRYMQMAYQRLSQIETFGLNDHKAMGKIMNIGYEGFDEDLALRTYRRATGRDTVDMIAKGAIQALKNWATASMIQFQTTLYHLPRTVYPAMEAGYIKAFKGFYNSFGEASEIESRRMGINLTQAMSEFLQDEYGGGKGISGKAAQKVLELEQIKALDRFDRKYSGIVGKDYIQNDLVKTLLRKPGNLRARNGLQSLGIDPDRIIADKKISDLDLNLGAKRYSDRWQGAPDPTTLPMWASTNPVANMAWQFKNFIYVISNEMASSIARAARSGDMATLARFGTLPLAGSAVYGIRHAIGMHDTKYVKDPKMNMALNILRDAAPLPISMDMFFKVLQGRRGVQDMMLSIFPAISNVTDIIGDAGETIRKGNMDKQTEKNLARHIPVVGTAVSHRIK